MKPRRETGHHPRDTILIVDDTPSNIQVLAEALSSNYEIKVATDGKAALEIMSQEEKPDMVLLDVMMPEMDGYQACRRIKQEPSIWDIPIIFVTAKAEAEDQQRGFDLGAVDYITKPFDIPLVMARINVHLRLKHKSEQLERLALLDGLTDIPNRRALEETLDRELRRSRREGTPISLVMIDVDHFKAFNDHYGHGAGDSCLRKIAHTIAASLFRPGDLVGRYGGEEFLVILPNSDQEGAVKVAENIRENVEELQIPHDFSPVTNHVTISMGVKSLLCRDRSRCSEALQQADQALYKAKEQGRNRVVVD